MSLPLFRWPTLRGLRERVPVGQGLGRQLAGQVIALPETFSQREQESTLDGLSTLLDWPVVTELEATAQGAALVLSSVTLAALPVPLEGGLRVCVLRRPPGERQVALPPAWTRLRDALMEVLGRSLPPGPRLQAVRWLPVVADSPATAVDFLNGSWALLAQDPTARAQDLLLGGLAAAVEGLLLGVDPRVAAWALALASGDPDPARLLDPAALALGKEEALLRALDCGLLLGLPEGLAPDFRRPLAALGHLASLPTAPDWSAMVPALAARLAPPLRLLVERLAAPPPRMALGLDPAPPPAAFVGREATLERLVQLLEPGDRVRTCVLWGQAGVGKTAVARRLAAILEPAQEILWLDFHMGPESAWQPVAAGLALDQATPSGATPGAPPWREGALSAVAALPVLLIVDGVDDLPEEDLRGWLPVGAGRAVVLVLSRSPLRTLQRHHDAIALQLGPLDRAEARQLLASRAPGLWEAIQRGDADLLLERVSHQPLALTSLAEWATREGALPSLAQWSEYNAAVGAGATSTVRQGDTA